MSTTRNVNTESFHIHTVNFTIWYKLSSSAVSRTISELCVYSFGHHPHPLGYPCAQISRQFCLVSTQFQWVLSCLDTVSNLLLFSLQYIDDYWKLGNWNLGQACLQLCSHRQHRQDKTVLSCLCRQRKQGIREVLLRKHLHNEGWVDKSDIEKKLRQKTGRRQGDALSARIFTHTFRLFIIGVPDSTIRLRARM